MATQIVLEWKAYPVKVDKVRTSLKSLISANYDGLICNEDNLIVVFKTDYSEADEAAVNTYWGTISAASFVTSMSEVITGKINDAMVFGQQVMVQASVENVLLGITQAGKTRDVVDYCSGLQRYLQSGSLYAALGEIDRLIAEGLPTDLSPFITEARLLSYKTKIQTFLGI